jgi:hypothetical protein
LFYDAALSWTIQALKTLNMLYILIALAREPWPKSDVGQKRT